jgi:hypothetical protein
MSGTYEPSCIVGEQGDQMSRQKSAQNKAKHIFATFNTYVGNFGNIKKVVPKFRLLL